MWCKRANIVEPRFLFSVAFAVVLCVQFGNCIMEYSSYTNGDMTFAMELLNLFEYNMKKMFKTNSFNSGEHQNFWRNLSANSKNTEETKGIRDVLRKEITYLMVTEQDTKKVVVTLEPKELTRLGVKLMIQFLCLNYSIKFAQGLKAYKEDRITFDPVHPTNLQFLAMYFGVFATEEQSKHLILDCFFVNAGSDQWKEMENISKHIRPLYKHFIKLIENEIVAKYQKRTGRRIEPIEFTEEDKSNLLLLNQHFAVLLFGAESTTKTPPPDYESLLWNPDTVQDLVNIILDGIKNDSSTMLKTELSSVGLKNVDPYGKIAIMGTLGDQSITLKKDSKLIKVLRKIEKIIFESRTGTENSDLFRFEQGSSLVLLKQPKKWNHFVQFMRNEGERFFYPNGEPLD